MTSVKVLKLSLLLLPPKWLSTLLKNTITGSMKTTNKPSKGFTVTLKNPFEELTVKALLEEQLLIPRKIRHFLRTKNMFLLMVILLTGKVVLNTVIRSNFFRSRRLS